jgi:hypothetical protein
MKKLLVTILLLNSTLVMAHSGHLSNESLHSFLHIEHIITLAAIGVIAFAVILLRNK